MTLRDTARLKAANKGWTYVASGLADTYSRPVSGWDSPISPKGIPAWDDIANWKPTEKIRVIYDASGDPLSAEWLSPDQTALSQGKWIGTREDAVGTKTQKATKVGTWLDRQAS